MSAVPTARYAFTERGDAVHLWPTCPWVDGLDGVSVVDSIQDVPARLHVCDSCSRRVDGTGPVRDVTVDPDAHPDKSNPENAAIGAEFERFVAERWPEIERVTDPDTPHWVDARFERSLTNETAGQIAAAGTPVDAKAAAQRSHGGERFGRWWFRRSHHEALLEAGGEYALGVYVRPAELTIAIEHAVLLPAQTVDTLLEGRWYAAGASHRAKECGQLPVSRVIDVSGGERV